MSKTKPLKPNEILVNELSNWLDANAGKGRILDHSIDDSEPIMIITITVDKKEVENVQA